MDDNTAAQTTDMIDQLRAQLDSEDMPELPAGTQVRHTEDSGVLEAGIQVIEGSVVQDGQRLYRLRDMPACLYLRSHLVPVDQDEGTVSRMNAGES